MGIYRVRAVEFGGNRRDSGSNTTFFYCHDLSLLARIRYQKCLHSFRFGSWNKEIINVSRLLRRLGSFSTNAIPCNPWYRHNGSSASVFSLDVQIWREETFKSLLNRLTSFSKNSIRAKPLEPPICSFDALSSLDVGSGSFKG